MRAFSIPAPNGLISGIEHGDGPPAVLLAGLGSTTRIWGEFPSVFGRRFRVIAVDNRGVGGSRDGRPFSFGAMAEDLITVLDKRGIDRAALLGASMGGVTALHTALAFPDRISRLVIVSAAARLSTHGRRVLETLHDLLLYAPPERSGTALMTLAFAPQFHERHAAFVKETEALWGPAEEDIPGILQQLEHLRCGWDLRDRLMRISAPALILAGDRDPIVSPEDTAEIAAGLPEGQLIEVPGAAHSVLAEGGTMVLKAVTDFLSGKPPRIPLV
jgi:pimeloyl-ACP methyl ester carboxylesterase